jgi:hypothetical protein
VCVLADLPAPAPAPNCARSSKAHFRQALAALAPEDGAPAATTKTKKTFACPHAGCLLVYKQQSGLRYHLSRVRAHAGPAEACY